MPVTNYFTVNGQIIGEETSGVRTDYLTDALGSVTATVDQSQNIINTYRWKPFGDLLSKTGTGTDPRFLWKGNTGSRTTGAVWAEQYNRARHYGKKQGQWTTVDPLWPGERAYGYVGGNPATRIDPSGQFPYRGDATCDPVGNKRITTKWCQKDVPRTIAWNPKTGGVFCNPHPDVLACPVFTAGMTGAWPHVRIPERKNHKEECCPNGKTARSHCVYPEVVGKYQEVDRVDCGELLWVSAKDKKGVYHSIVISIIDVGPHGTLGNGIIDLHPQAAEVLHGLIGKKYEGCSATKGTIKDVIVHKFSWWF